MSSNSTSSREVRSAVLVINAQAGRLYRSFFTAAAPVAAGVTVAIGGAKLLVIGGAATG